MQYKIGQVFLDTTHFDTPKRLECVGCDYRLNMCRECAYCYSDHNSCPQCNSRYFIETTEPITE